MRAVVALPLWFALHACVFDEALPQDGSLQLLCASDLDCPETWVCASSLERCVPRARVDGDDPAIERVSLEPATVAPGGEFTFSFLVTERLGRAPIVTLEGEPLDLVAPADASPDALSYAATGRAPQVTVDVDLPLTVRLVDEGGNSADLAPRALRVDATPPSVIPGSVSMRLVPPVGSPAATVEAVGAGAVLEVSFLTSELLAASPQPSAGPWVSSGGVNTGGLAWSLVFEAAPDALDGTYPVDVELEDGVGNRAVERLLVDVEIDRQAPAPPAVDVDGAIVLERAPWGAEATNGDPRAQVRCAGLDVGDTLIIANATSGLELARGRISVPEGATVTLPADVPRVTVTRMDRAGNVSATVWVRDVEWTASLRGKVLGSSIENPHALWDMPAAPVARHHPEEREVTPNLVVEQSARSWVDDTAARPPPSIGAAAAYDADEGRVIVYGGQRPIQSGAAQGWSWDGTLWRSLVEAPGPRVLARLVYDAARKRMVLLGGIDSTTDLTASDVWELAGESWIRTGSFAQAAQVAPAAEFHPALARTLLVANGNTWSYDGAAWRDEGPAPAATQPALIYDAARRALVLLGADDGDTWLRADDAWEPLDIPAPPPWGVNTSATDSITGRALMDNGTSLMRLGEAAWEEAAPSARVGEDTVVYAAMDATGRAFAWTTRARRLSDDGWRDVDEDRLPAVTRFGFVFSRALGAPLALTDAGAFRWARFGRESEPVSAVFIAPLLAETEEGALLYSDVEQRTFAWTTSGVAEVPDASIGAPTLGAAVAWDEARNEVLVYGAGAAQDEMWFFDGVSWQQRVITGPTPGPRPDAAMAFDRARGVTVLFGGTSPETWEWDGGAWRLADAAGPPEQFIGPRLAYDERSGHVLLFGGALPGFIARALTWSWDGNTWTQIRTLSLPAGRAMHGLLVDERDETLIAQSGFWELYLGTPLADTSLLSLAPRSQTLRFDVRTDVARAEGATLTGATLRVQVDGPGTALAVEAFDAGRDLRWRALGAPASGVLFSHDLDAAEARDAVFVGPQGASFRVSAAPTHALDASTLSLSVAELTVRYRFSAP